MSSPQECYHEELIQSQARRMERIEAELNYKREKLDVLKEDNRRMEEKIDNIQDCMNKLMLKSTTDDDKITNEITAIKTRLNTQEKMTNKNRDDTNLKISVVAVILVIIDLLLKYLH